IASRVKKASFVAANTNVKALREVRRNVLRFPFGEAFTHGLGTGMNVELGENAAIAEKGKIKKLFEDQDLCIIVACLGGGTGSGSAPIFAKIAKSTGCLTYGIFTLPFEFEGERKAAIAKAALEELKPKLHAISIIPNERIFQIIQKETPLKQALSAINEKLAQSLEGLIEIIYEPGLINIDFADLKTVLEGQGRLTYLNTVKVPRKEGNASEAIEKLLNSPLYPYGIRGAKGVLYNIAGEKNLTLEEVGQISKTISGLVNKEARIIFGIAQNPKYAGVVETTLLATGCGTKIFSKPAKKRKQKIAKKEAEVEKPVVRKKRKKKKISKSKIGANPKNKPPKKKQTRIKAKALKPKKAENAGPAEARDNTNTTSDQEGRIEVKIRKNALQIKKEAEQEEAEMLARERIWETPAFLRRRKVI
ncbi:MAG: cell division protein FtsZ, partial [Patescibacteria group bacterium]